MTNHSSINVTISASTCSLLRVFYPISGLNMEMEHVLAVVILRYYVRPVVCCLGFAANMISLEILRRNGLRKQSNLLLFGLVLADSLYLISGMNFALVISIVGTNDVFPNFCLLENEALNFFLVAYVHAMSNAGHWGLLVGAVIPILITGERLLASFRPMAVETLVTAKKTAMTVACSFMVSLTWTFCVNIMFTPVKVSLSELVIRIYLGQPKTQTTLLVAKLGLHVINISLSYLTIAIVTPGCCVIWVKVQLTLRRRRKLASFQHQRVMSSRKSRTIIVTCLLHVLTDGTIYVCTSIAVLFEGFSFYFLHESKFYIYPLKASSSCFVYVFCNEQFYRHFKEILRISDDKNLAIPHGQNGITVVRNFLGHKAKNDV